MALWAACNARPKALRHNQGFTGLSKEDTRMARLSHSPRNLTYWMDTVNA